MSVKLCECGCGQPAPIARKHRPGAGVRRGDPQRFINGHRAKAGPTGEERLWAGTVKTETCWLWTGSRRKAYGRLRVQGRVVSVHRFAYELLVGPIPDGLTIDHLCRQTLCIRPDHLEPVTAAENLRRENEALRREACVNGHEFTDENSGWTTDGNRRCRACARIRAAANRAAARDMAGAA